ILPRAAQVARAQAGPAMQVQRSVITLYPATGETPRIPERLGMTLRGSLPALDLHPWLPLFSQGGTDGEGVGYGLQIGVLEALGKRMRAVTMQGATDGMGWSASMNTAEFNGDVVYRTEGGGKLVARMTRFMLPENSPGAKSGEALKDLPALDIIADNFTHRGRKLGRVELLARH